MVSITKRLRDLREDNDLTQKYIADKLGIAKQRYGEWERGEHKPSIEAVISLALLYNVSTDYLLGLTDNPKRI